MPIYLFHFLTILKCLYIFFFLIHQKTNKFCFNSCFLQKWTKFMVRPGPHTHRQHHTMIPASASVPTAQHLSTRVGAHILQSRAQFSVLPHCATRKCHAMYTNQLLTLSSMGSCNTTTMIFSWHPVIFMTISIVHSNFSNMRKLKVIWYYLVKILFYFLFLG